MRIDPWSLGVAAVFAAFALLTLGVWIPADVESGVVETFRRRIVIGDAMAPTAVAAGMIAAAVLLAVSTVLGRRREEAAPDRQSALFVVRFAAVIAAALVLMSHTGPLVVDAINGLGGAIGSYRELRDTVPYKYLGYLIGGAVLVGGTIALVEQRLTSGAAFAGILAAAVLAALYDLPFDDLLLPPNGDQ